MLTRVFVTENPDYPFDNHPEMLIDSVILYVNTAIRSGGVGYAQLPLDAARMYWMDYYVAQVINGGHSQYIRNSHLLLFGLSYAREGLVKTGITPLLKLFDEFVAWIWANPETAQRQTGFGKNIPTELEEFDRRLYAFGADEYRKIAASWINEWPELCIVAEHELTGQIEAAIDDAYRRNPEQLWRRHLARASLLEYPGAFSAGRWQVFIFQNLCAQAKPSIRYVGFTAFSPKPAQASASTNTLSQLRNKARSGFNTLRGFLSFPKELWLALDPCRINAIKRGKLRFEPLKTSAGRCAFCSLNGHYYLVGYNNNSVGRLVSSLSSQVLNGIGKLLSQKLALAAVHLCHQAYDDLRIVYIASMGPVTADGAELVRLETTPQKPLSLIVNEDKVALIEDDDRQLIAQITMTELEELHANYQRKTMDEASDSHKTFYDEILA